MNARPLHKCPYNLYKKLINITCTSRDKWSDNFHVGASNSNCQLGIEPIQYADNPTLSRKPRKSSIPADARQPTVPIPVYSGEPSALRTIRVPEQAVRREVRWVRKSTGRFHRRIPFIFDSHMLIHHDSEAHLKVSHFL